MATGAKTGQPDEPKASTGVQPGSTAAGSGMAAVKLDRSEEAANLGAPPPGAPCCSLESPKPLDQMRGQATKSIWQWQEPEGENPNHLAFHVPRNPDMFANTEVGTLETKLIEAGSVKYSVILPPGHRKDRAQPYPLVISLHPAPRDHEHLIDPSGAARTGRDIIGSREVVWASYDGGKGNVFLDWKDGSQQWETFFIEEFIPFIEKQYNCGGHQCRRYLTGICMGGVGVLMYAFKYPRSFAAAAAQQPAIPCGVDPKELPVENQIGWARHRKFADHDAIEGFRKFGAESNDAIDPAWFRGKISPIAMAIDNADEIRDSGLELFLDAGDQDCFDIHNPTELLHRTLWYERIPHEYHLVRGGNHMGSSWRRRGPEAIDFLFRVMEQVLSPVEIMTEEEKNWSAWKASQQPDAKVKTDGPEPPVPKFDFSNSGVFSDKNAQHIHYQHKAKGVCLDRTEGPPELMGHPWRKPRSE